MDTNSLSQIQDSFAGYMDKYNTWVKKTGKSYVNFHDYLKYSGNLSTATNLWSGILAAENPAEEQQIPEELQTYITRYQNWVNKTGKDYVQFEDYLFSNAPDKMDLLEGINIDAILNANSADKQQITENRYFNYTENGENKLLFQTKNGEVLVIDALTGEAKAASEAEIANMFGVNENAYDNMDFNNNGMTISEFAFTGLGDELADRNEIPSAHYVYEEIDAINNQDRIKNIINEYVKDRGELKDLRDIFGNEQGAAHNVNYSEDGLTMTITQNGKTVIVNYDKETGAITFENLDDLTALLIRNNDTDADGNISRQELASIITGESTDVDQTFLSYLTGKLTAQAGGNDALLSKEELSGLLDQNTDGIVTQEEIDAFNSAIKGRVSVMKEMFDSIDSDQDGSISKDNFITGLKNNQGLKADANANLVSYMFDDLIRPMAGDDGNISKEEFMAALDRNGNGVFEQEEIDGFDAVLQTKVDVINNAQEWQGCGNTQGYIDWNKDGRFDNEIDHYGSYIARHGHMDTFFNRFDYNWGGYQINNLNDILEDYDNKSSRDMDQRAGFVSDGTVTVHKISDTQIGFNVTEYDQAKAAGVDYNYVVWDKEKRTFLIGQDLNNDGNLTDAEIMGIVENVGIRTSSPLTFDLNGDGKVSTTGISKEYDINGDGIVDQTAWAGAGDGVLAFDADGDGIIGEDGKELFGNNTDVDGNGKADGFKNGFEALGALASRYLGAEALKDGKLDATELKQLELRAGLSMFVDGTQKSLSDLGISEISLGYEEVAVDESRDENGNEHRQIGEGFVINGQKAKVDDVWFQYAA